MIWRKLILFFGIVTLLLSSCEDPISIDLEEGPSQLTVDGFIKFYLDSEALNLGVETQIIKLRKTTAYFNNKPAPPALGAEVTVTDLLGRTFIFKDLNSNGNYEYNGPFVLSFTNPPLGFPGNAYRLNIKYEGEEYEAKAYMDSVPKLDSLSFVFKEQLIRGPDTLQAGYIIDNILSKENDGIYYPTKDIKGEGTCYWFKTFKNNVFYNNPHNMLTAYDAAFGPGSDHVPFVLPIVHSLSPERFYQGDTVRVECWSIGLPTYYFLNMAQIQMTNEGLFATPPTNVPSNIENKNKNSKNKAVGWFSAAAISRVTEIVP